MTLRPIPRAYRPSEIRQARAGTITNDMRQLMMDHVHYQSDQGWKGEEGRLAAAMMLCGPQADDDLLEAVSDQIVEARQAVEGAR